MKEVESKFDTNRRVLIVEDEPKLREVLSRAIREMEFEPTATGTAEEGLELLKATEYAIILSDLNLPGMHGMELCREVRLRWPKIQLLILTGYGDLEAAQAAIHLDVVDFLTKPCALGDLEMAFNRALRRREHHVIAHRIDGEGFDSVDKPDTSLETIERKHILEMLDHHYGNREIVAEELGISVRTLYYRLKQYAVQGYMDV